MWLNLQLTILDASKNEIRSLDEMFIGKRHSIYLMEEFYAAGNGITYFKTSYISHMVWLKYLNIHENKLRHMWNFRVLYEGRIRLYISFNKMHLKMSSAKWRPFCLGLNVLTFFIIGQAIWNYKIKGRYLAHVCTINRSFINWNINVASEIVWKSFYSSRVPIDPKIEIQDLGLVDSLRLTQNDRLFADKTFKCIFLNENGLITIKISLKFVPRDQINNIPALAQITACRRSGDKPLSEPMMVSSPTHICVTRPQWVN